MKFQIITSFFILYFYVKAICLTASSPPEKTRGDSIYNNVTNKDLNNKDGDGPRESRQFDVGGLQAPYYFCGQIIGGHYMFGSTSTYCGGYSVPDCSALCFFRNFTFFQCEGFVCHCYTIPNTATG